MGSERWGLVVYIDWYAPNRVVRYAIQATSQASYNVRRKQSTEKTKLFLQFRYEGRLIEQRQVEQHAL